MMAMFALVHRGGIFSRGREMARGLDVKKSQLVSERHRILALRSHLRMKRAASTSHIQALSAQVHR